ncbi:MAG: hypothetical protein NC453_22560 [Muribaculum sp.]|nr:hypothetical protein [Muribaculum sp.]
MKTLSTLDLISLIGGWIDPVECARVQREALALQEKGADDGAWEVWMAEYDKYCGGSNV